MDTDSDFSVTEFDTVEVSDFSSIEALVTPRAAAPAATEIEAIEDVHIASDPSASKQTNATFNIDDPPCATVMKEGGCDPTQAKIEPAVADSAPLEPAAITDRFDMNTTKEDTITLHSLVPLLELLSAWKEVDGYLMLAGEITDDDISRLYEYSGRATEFVYLGDANNSDAPMISPDVYLRLSQRIGGAPLLPSLHSLQLLSVSAELSYLPLFFSSSLTYLKICNISPAASHLVKSFLATLPYEAPGLQAIELHGTHQLPAVALYPIINLKQLRLLELNDVVQIEDFSLLERLSTLPHLTTFNFISHNLSSVASFSMYSVHNIGFEKLKNLRVTGSFTLIHKIVTLVSSKELEVLQLVPVLYSEDYLLAGSERYPSDEQLRAMEREKEEELHIWRKREVMEPLSPENREQLSSRCIYVLTQQVDALKKNVSDLKNTKNDGKKKGKKHKEALQFSLDELQTLLNSLLALQAVDDLTAKSATSLLAQRASALHKRVSDAEDELRIAEEGRKQEERKYKDQRITKKMKKLSAPNVSEAEKEAARKVIEEEPFPGHINKVITAKAALQPLLDTLQMLEMALLELQIAENPPLKSACSSLDSSSADALTGVSIVDKEPASQPAGGWPDLLKQTIDLLTSQWADSLKHLTLNIDDRHPAFTTSDHAFAFPESVFLFLERLHALELLNIEKWGIVGLSSSLPQAIRGWPKIQTLHIPLEDGPGIGLEVFRTIADFCPELRSLQISVDLSSLPPLSEECGASFALRHELNMLSVNSFSGISHGKKDILLIARYLNILFPHLKMEFASRTNCEQAAGLWKEVYELVRAFQLVREDERNRV